MNIVTLTLYVHLLGALCALILTLSSVRILLTGLTHKIPSHISLFNITSFFLIATGALLSSVSRGDTLAHCTKLGFYLMVIIGIQLLLFVRYKTGSIRPVMYTHSLNAILIGSLLIYDLR